MIQRIVENFEATGPERMRIEMQRMVAAEPFHLDGNPDELLKLK